MNGLTLTPCLSAPCPVRLVFSEEPHHERGGSDHSLIHSVRRQCRESEVWRQVRGTSLHCQLVPMKRKLLDISSEGLRLPSSCRRDVDLFVFYIFIVVPGDPLHDGIYTSGEASSSSSVGGTSPCTGSTTCCRRSCRSGRNSRWTGCRTSSACASSPVRSSGHPSTRSRLGRSRWHP